VRIDIEISFVKDKVYFHSPDGRIHRTLSNLMGLDQQNKFASLGQSQEDMLKAGPQNAERIRRELHFEPIYEPSRGYVDLGKVAACLRYELTRVSTELKRPPIFRTWLDAYSIDLWLPEFEFLDRDARADFVFEPGIRVSVRRVAILADPLPWLHMARAVSGAPACLAFLACGRR
jgi:hypothetical protein